MLSTIIIAIVIMVMIFGILALIDGKRYNDDVIIVFGVAFIVVAIALAICGSMMVATLSVAKMSPENTTNDIRNGSDLTKVNTLQTHTLLIDTLKIIQTK